VQGHELRAQRKGAGLTQGELAAAVGLTLGFIGEMERGEKAIERRTELAIRYVLEHGVDWVEEMLAAAPAG